MGISTQLQVPPKRSHPRDQFTTYLNISGLDRSSSGSTQPWLRDRPLDRNFLAHQTTLGEQKEKAWTLYWHRQWQQAEIAQRHLEAYLHEPAFWAANTFRLTLQSTPITVLECFQVCLLQTITYQKTSQTLFEYVLLHFSDSPTANLRSLAQTILKNELARYIEQQYGIISRNDWSLLKTDDYAIKAPLADIGIQGSEYLQIRKLLDCYRLLFHHNPPNPNDWELMTAAYNRAKDPDWPSIDSPRLQATLVTCAKAIRSYYRNQRSPGSDSIDAFENPDAMLGVELPSQLELEEAAQEEQQHQDAMRSLQEQLNQQLTESFQKLPAKQQTILQLKYGPEPLGRDEIAKEMDFSGDPARARNKVSQALGRATKNLTAAIIPWLADNLHFFTTAPLDDDEQNQKLKSVIKHFQKTGIKLWLEDYLAQSQ